MAKNGKKNGEQTVNAAPEVVSGLSLRERKHADALGVTYAQYLAAKPAPRPRTEGYTAAIEQLVKGVAVGALGMRTIDSAEVCKTLGCSSQQLSNALHSMRKRWTVLREGKHRIYLAEIKTSAEASA